MIFFFTSDFFKSLIYMNLTQIIVYKHRYQQSFVCFFNTKAQSAQTCIALLTPDSLIVKYFMTLCIPDKKKSNKSNKLKKSDLNLKHPIFFIKKTNHYFFQPWPDCGTPFSMFC